MSDYNYLPVSDGSGDASLMHLTGNRSIGATVLAVDSVVGVPSHFIGCVGTLLATGFIDPTTKTDFKGHVSTGTLVIDAFEPGNSDVGNTSGQVVVVKPNTGWANRVANFIMNATNNGTPEPHYVSNLIASGNVTTATLTATGAVEFDGTTKIVGTSYFAAQSIASAATITPASQLYRVTALAVDATVAVPSYTPQDGMSGELRIVDNGTIRNLTWASGWKAIGITLPTATVVGQYMYISYEYSLVDTKWHVLAVARG